MALMAATASRRARSVLRRSPRVANVSGFACVAGSQRAGDCCLRDDAIPLLEAAATHFAASHARLEYQRTLTDLGARRRAVGDPRAARTILRDAHDAAHACRDTPVCDRSQTVARTAAASGPVCNRPRLILPPDPRASCDAQPAARSVLHVFPRRVPNCAL